ncbi:MAG: hypothetical protein ACFB6R_14520 [Alphaproteobacteria bacterium]
MKTVFRGLLESIGIDWVMKTAILAMLEVLKEIVQETDNTWDDRLVVPIVDAVMARLQGEDPAPHVERARPALERFAGLAPVAPAITAGT